MTFVYNLLLKFCVAAILWFISVLSERWEMYHSVHYMSMPSDMFCSVSLSLKTSEQVFLRFSFLFSLQVPKFFIFIFIDEENVLGGGVYSRCATLSFCC